MIWCIKAYIIAYVKTHTHKKILSIMSNVQPDCCLKFDFQKVDQHAAGKWLIHDTKRRKDNHSAEYPSWVARCDIKGSVSTVLNPIFSKKVQGQKHPGRWGIVEHRIPSIKMLFKTNTKGHKHPSIRLLSKSKTQLVKQRKQKVAFSPGTAHSPEIQSYSKSALVQVMAWRRTGDKPLYELILFLWWIKCQNGNESCNKVPSVHFTRHTTILSGATSSCLPTMSLQKLVRKRTTDK